MLYAHTAQRVASRRRLPHASVRIDVRIETEPGLDRSRADIRRIIRMVLERCAGKVLLPRHAVAIDVLVTDNAEIRRLNALHRRINRATDALSFPQFEPREVQYLWGVPPPACFRGRGRRPKNADPTPPDSETGSPSAAGHQPIHLGDIVLSLPMIEHQAARRDTTVQEELEFVVAHSLLHLLGCDHDTPARHRAMWDYTHLLIWNGPQA